MNWTGGSSKADRVKYARESGDVQRCHTLRTIGEYSTAQHSFNMLTMLMIVWPDAPITLYQAIITHDQPERLTGDIPAPAKWHMSFDLDNLEFWVNERIYGKQHEHELGPMQKRWLKGLDIIELWCFCRDQIHLGNRNFEKMKGRIEKYIKTVTLPVQLDFLYEELQAHDWTMQPDLGE